MSSRLITRVLCKAQQGGARGDLRGGAGVTRNEAEGRIGTDGRREGPAERKSYGLPVYHHVACLARHMFEVWSIHSAPRRAQRRCTKDSYCVC